MTLRVVAAWPGLLWTFDWESLASSARFLTSPVAQWGRRVGSKHALLSFRTATRSSTSLREKGCVGSRARSCPSHHSLLRARARAAPPSVSALSSRAVLHPSAFASGRAVPRSIAPRTQLSLGPRRLRRFDLHPAGAGSRGCHALCRVFRIQRSTLQLRHPIRLDALCPPGHGLGWAQARGLPRAAADPRIGFTRGQMPLAVVCSWLGCQRAPCETPDCRHPPTVPPDDSRDLTAIAFVQPPLGCDVVVHVNVEARLAAASRDREVPRQHASLRLTGTVGLCPPVVPGSASSPVSEGLPRDALPNCGTVRFRNEAIALRRSCHRRSRSPVFSGPGWFEVARQHRRAPVERMPTEAFRSRMLFVATALSHRLQCLRQQPGTLRRQRTTSPPLGTRAPSAAESRAWLRRFRRPRSSRHSYAGFATSAELPTCLHAMRARARSSRRPTFPPRRLKATCRPSTSTNHDDPRAHPWTLATSASGLASHRQPSDPPCG